MKTIFYEQNQLNISNKPHSKFYNCFHNPNKETIKIILNQFLDKKPFVGLVVDENNSFLKLLKKQLFFIEAAGGLVINSKNEILLIKRLGFWDLPKGKLEENETVTEGAIREVSEECGISNLSIHKKLKPSYHVYYHKKNWILKKTYWFLMNHSSNEQLIPQIEENITEVKWVKQSEINNYEPNTYPAITKVLHQSLSL